MLPGFENITRKLTPKEIEQLVPRFIKGFRKHVGRDNAVSSTQIIEGFLKTHNLKLAGSTVRKIVNHIRRNNLLPGLVACGDGYYVTNDPAEIRRYIESLEGREAEIRRIKNGMKEHYNRLIQRQQEHLSFPEIAS